MGIANFYIKIKLNSKIENAYNELKTNPLFICLCDSNNNEKFIVLDCVFDNFVPTLLIIYDFLQKNGSNEVLIETYGCEQSVILNSFEDFVRDILKINKNKLIGYYEELGYFFVDSKKYYKKRGKLRKYYKKLKI